jgi:hypothetical protein
MPPAVFSSDAETLINILSPSGFTVETVSETAAID